MTAKKKLSEREIRSRVVVSIWTPKIVAKLGKQSDHSIAKELGVYTSSVTAYRRSRKIPPFVELSFHKWSKAERALLGKFSDRVVAEKLNLSLHTVSAERHGWVSKAAPKLPSVVPGQNVNWPCLGSIPILK